MSKVIVSIRCDSDQDRALIIAHIRSMYADKVVEVIRVGQEVTVSKMTQTLAKTADHFDRCHQDLTKRMAQAGLTKVNIDPEQANLFKAEVELKKEARDLANGVKSQM